MFSHSHTPVLVNLQATAVSTKVRGKRYKVFLIPIWLGEKGSGESDARCYLVSGIR